ncbi:putative nicotinate-nucleotide adenylyltransferase [Candidatus Nitrotoga sp. HW29]|uniref:nicotinate-nucleotide adenylyltransferase n=1 Tax=Candidatus Nitrotoga sp. HW29 TaxID=2886963 RepID=UPI001EF33FEE|nr:nicotinate-nucleotide adenylyltransferase [Candidatus Nitrotoga sp. HW29]CAH1906446.1 putative nicotinate-nucleotide adenylyltransferase [Candidatus Nitrotoga sp. HW29]
MNQAPIGILGGTFDPVHNGHLRLAQEALEQCNLAAVHFIPSGTPPHRNAPRANAIQRLDMVRLALQDNAAFVLDECEIYRTDPCYTVNTLSALRAKHGIHQPLCLLMGGDAFLLLHSWHEWKSLFELSHIVVMQRAGHPLGNAINGANETLRDEYRTRLVPAPRILRESPAGAILVANMPALEISATDIRKRCAENKNIHYLLPDAVADYIQLHHLYT